MDGDWYEASEVKVLVSSGESTRTTFGDEATARLKRLGASALTDVELLAVLGVAASEADVKPVLMHGLAHLLDAPELAFQVAPMLTARLHAAIELSRRVPARRVERPRLYSPNAIATWARTQLIQHRLEETWVVALNSRNHVLRFDRVGTGGSDHCHVDAREALAPAVCCRASGIVLIHTHPSSDPEPSIQDVATTRKLRTSAQTLNIVLLDHLVLSDTGYVSMLEKGLLDGGRGAAVMRRPVFADEVD